MSCIRCEVARAKVIAMGMAGLSRSLADIHQALVDRYGPVYIIEGKTIYRMSPGGNIRIHGGR